MMRQATTLFLLISLSMVKAGCAGRGGTESVRDASSRLSIQPSPSRTAPMISDTPSHAKLPGMPIDSRRFAPYDAASPDDYAGSIMYKYRHKSSEEYQWYFEPIAKPNNREQLDKRIFEAIADQGALASAKLTFLASIAGSMQESDKVVFSIFDLYRVRGPDPHEVKDKIDIWIADRREQDIECAFYCRSALTSAVTYQTYSEVRSGLEVAGPVFAVNGTYYNSNSFFSTKIFVSVDTSPISLPSK